MAGNNKSRALELLDAAAELRKAEKRTGAATGIGTKARSTAAVQKTASLPEIVQEHLKAAGAKAGEEKEKQQAKIRQQSAAAFKEATRSKVSQSAFSRAESEYAKKQAEAAQKTYEAYLKSDEYRTDRENEGVTGFSNEAEYYAEMQGKGSGSSKEKELKAKAEYWQQQSAQKADESTMEKDMEELASWPKEDRAALETYIIESEREKYNWQGEPSFESARYNASALFNKYGAQKIKEMAESYARYHNAQNAEQTARKASEKAGESVGGAIGQSAASVAAGIAGAVTAPLGYLGEVTGRTGRYSTMDPNNAGNLPNVYSGAVRQQVAEDIEGDEGNGVRKVLSYGYQGIMSAADSLARLAATGGTGWASLGLAAMGSFGQTMSEASKQGASPAQAVIQATADAGLEVLTEKLPMDELLKTAKGGAKTAGQVIGDVLKQAGIEATTEEISLLGSIAAEAVTLQGKSAYNQQIGDLVANGMSYQDAKAQADRALWEEAKQTAIVSAISGGASSGGAAVAANVAEQAQGKTDYFAGLLRGLTKKPEAETTPTEREWAAQRLGDLVTGTADGTYAIRENMPEAERYKVLKDRKVNVVTDEGSANHPEEMASLSALKAKAKSKAEKIIKPLARKLGILNRTMTTPELDVEFVFSSGGLNESIHKQLRYGGDYGDFAKTMINLDKVLQNAVLVEKHGDKYAGTSRASRNLENVYVLFGAFRDGNNVIPVQMEIKKTSDAGSRLYMTVAMTKIEADVLGKAVDPGQAPSLISASKYNIADIFGKINPNDAHFLKYLPDDFLSVEQRQAKQIALAEDAARIEKYKREDQRKSQEAQPTTEEVRAMFPSETAPQKETENLYRQREAIERQLYEASEAGNFGEEFNLASQHWSELSERIRALEGEDTERADSLRNEEAPPEREMAAPVARRETAAVNPLEGRTEQSVGSRKVKAYQYENPEVKPFFQDAARGILADINGSTPGEKNFDDKLYYESGGEKGWSGTKRKTTRDIAEIKDSYGYTWDELREAAEDIIHDRGNENNAASKRLEFLIHERLANGYTDVEGRHIPANREYLNFLEERQVNEYRRESLDSLVDSAGQYAPQESPEGFEAMGAASYNFNPFTRMQNEYGNIPDGENAVRPDDMPISTDGNDRVSYTARTAKGAGVTPEDFVPLIENEVVRGGFSFIPITNNESVQAAQQTIMAEGWRTARANWTADVRRGRAGDQITAIGALLYNNAVNEGQYQEAMDILLDYQMAVRNSARGLQAARILKTLTPENRLYMLRRSVQRMIEDMHLDIDIDIDENLARQYQETRDNARADEILDQIIDDVARQIPSTALERWTALRYVNMLGNFRTQVRNIAGNIGAQAAYRTKDTIAAVIEAAADHATGGQFRRTKSVAVNRDLLRAARADFENVRGQLLDGGRYNDAGNEFQNFARQVNERRRIFRNPVMEGYRRGTNWAMNNDYFGDAAFGRAAYGRALAGYLQANGVRGDSLDSVDTNLLDEARAYAIQEAQEATFRDNNAVSDWISRIGRRADTPTAARAISEGIMPFRRTPANVLVRAEEFSPLGLVNATVSSIRAARGGDVTGADVVNSWAKALTGTGLTILGAALGNAGLLIGGPDADEDEAEFDELNGYQNYALLLPDGTNLTIDFLSPVAMPLFLGAQLQKIMSEGGYQLSDLETVFTSIADPMIQMSMLQGVNDTLDNIKYSENNMGQFLLNAATSYLSQGITNTLMGQLERSSEDVRMTTYVDKDSPLSPWMQRQLGKISQKIPGIDYQQIPYLNAWGEEEQNPEGAWDYLYNLLSPAYISKGTTDALAQELYRLNEVQSDVNVFPDSPETTLTFKDKDGNLHENYNLSAEQWQTMARTEGQTQNRIAKALTESADYAALTDDQKAKAISFAYDYAREKGRVEAIEGYPGMSESWMEGIDGKEAGAIINKVAAAAITDSFSALTESWRNGLSGTEAAEDLEGAYEVYKGLSLDARKKVLESASGRMEYYLTARSKGISTETFVDLYKTYWDIDQSDSDTSAKAQQWSYELQRAREAGKITESQKDALKESMVYMQMFPAETEKFDQMTESGISAKKALDVGKLLKGLTPKAGKSSVTAVQQAEAIAGAKLTDSEMSTVMKLYLNDTQDQNIDDMAAMGYSAADYAAAYSIYTAEKDKGGDGTKNRIVNKYMDLFGVDKSTATAIYEIYG